jgi:hypothetical protein
MTGMLVGGVDTVAMALVADLRSDWTLWSWVALAVSITPLFSDIWPLFIVSYTRVDPDVSPIVAGVVAVEVLESLLVLFITRV